MKGIGVSSATFGEMIGNYSQQIPDYSQCGLSRKSLEIDFSCFDWHRDYNPGIIHSKEAAIGEAPWTVSIKSYKRLKWLFDAAEELLAEK